VKLLFDVETVTDVEFGVGREDEAETTFSFVPVDDDVQNVLREMVVTTAAREEERSAGSAPYDPADKHAQMEYLILPLGDELARSLRELHESANLPTNADALDDPSVVFCYFVKMKDAKERRLTAVRRATQFKGTVGKRLIRFLTNALRLVRHDVFKLDIDCDLLVDAENVHILRPSAFEALVGAREAVVAAAPTNVAAIARDMRFVEFTGISEYAQKHPRAARLLASIRATGNSRNISPGALRSLCRRNGVKVKSLQGSIVVQAGHELAFLEVLDRRRYEVELVSDRPERYRAASRQPVRD
jgi:hypothetical protein